MAQVPVRDSQTEEEGRANCPMSVGRFCQFPVASSPGLRPRGVQVSQNRKGLRPLLGCWLALAGRWFPRCGEAREYWGGRVSRGPKPAWVPWNPGTPSCSVRARCCPSNPAMPYLPPCSPDSNTVGWLRPRKSPPARDQRTRREGGALAPQCSILANRRRVGVPDGGLQRPRRGSRGRPRATQREGCGAASFPGCTRAGGASGHCRIPATGCPRVEAVAEGLAPFCPLLLQSRLS